MAKEQKQEQNPPPAPDAPEGVGPPKSYRLYILLGFISLILFEMTLLFLLLPAKQPDKKAGIDPNEGPGNYRDVSPDPKEIIKPEVMSEIQVGDRNTFKISQNRSDGNETFSLIMHISVKKAEESRFQRRYDQCVQEIIDRATGILGASTTEERREPNHTTIKERLKRAMNEVLGTPWVQKILFSEVNHAVN